MTYWFAPATTFTALTLFWLSVAQLQAGKLKQHEQPAEIVVASPIQVLLYGGDRFLAANIESVRATASATTADAQEFRLRAHQTVSRLNPCHEDNYWVGNAALTWGGAEEQGFEVLYNAMRCRFWDEWPAFFYGFNKSFFLNDREEARRVLEVAAQRSPQNAAAFRNFSIMLVAGEIDDTRMALEMLQRERKEAKEPALGEMLDKRIGRLEGLLLLRDSQSIFESRYAKALTQPSELLESGVLESFPQDPLGLGYEFRDNTFHLRKMKIQ